MFGGGTAQCMHTQTHMHTNTHKHTCTHTSHTQVPPSWPSAADAEAAARHAGLIRDYDQASLLEVLRAPSDQKEASQGSSGNGSSNGSMLDEFPVPDHYGNADSAEFLCAVGRCVCEWVCL